MEKKIYSEPVMAVELFTPNQFVAACGDDWIPAEQIGSTFWADVVKENWSGYTYGPDGIINESTVESFLYGHAPNAATGAEANLLRGHWFENMTLYKKVTSVSIPSGTSYTNTRYMQPMSGYEDVAIYITKGGVAKVWIYTGNNGNKPTNPDWQNPGQTINMS